MLFSEVGHYLSNKLCKYFSSFCYNEVQCIFVKSLSLGHDVTSLGKIVKSESFFPLFPKKEGKKYICIHTYILFYFLDAYNKRKGCFKLLKINLTKGFLGHKSK